MSSQEWGGGDGDGEEPLPELPVPPPLPPPPQAARPRVAHRSRGKENPCFMRAIPDSKTSLEFRRLPARDHHRGDEMQRYGTNDLTARTGETGDAGRPIRQRAPETTGAEPGLCPFPVRLGKSQGTMATIRSGPPLPPRIFMGSAITRKPVSGRRSRCATFSNAGMFSANRMRWDWKSDDWP